jgi:hypothetical protein
MPFGPYFADLPADSGGYKYVDQTRWNQLLANFEAWQDNVSANGYNLSNLGDVTFQTGKVIKTDAVKSTGTTQPLKLSRNKSTSGILFVTEPASSPTDKLQLEAVSSAGSSTASELGLTGYAGGVLPLIRMAADNFTLTNGGGVTPKVGVGTASPATQYHMVSPDAATEHRVETTAAATAFVFYSLKTATQQWEMSTARGGANDRSLYFYNRTDGRIQLQLTQDGIFKAFAGTQSKLAVFELTIADGASVNLTSYCGGGSYGILDVATGTLATCGSVFLKGGFNTVQELTDASSTLSITDTAGQLCFLSAGSGQFNVKNRLGGPAIITFRFVGQ